MAKINEAITADIIAKANNGWTHNAIAEFFGLARETVTRLLKKHNVTPPKRIIIKAKKEPNPRTVTITDKTDKTSLSEPKIVELTSQLTVANLSESQQNAIDNHIGFDKSVLDSLKLIDINLRNGIATNTIPVDIQVDLVAKLAMTLDKLGLINSVSNVGVDDVVVKINLGSKATVEPIKEISEVENADNDRTTQNVS